jgi:hypothetical protein
MDILLKSFSLGFLLRSAFAGTFFVLAYYMATSGTCQAIAINSGNVFSLGLVFALVAGVTVYGMHRSLIFPWIEWFLNSNLARKLRKGQLPLVSENTVKDIVRRWDSKSEKEQERRNRTEQITVWADYVHFQYVSAWCTLIGVATGVIVSGRYPPPHWHRIVALAVLFIVAASVSAWRGRSVEEHCVAIENAA